MSSAILSIQSWVAYGHVGNAAALFPLQRLGFEAWGVHTVQFSNHTGYGAWRGRVMEAASISEVVLGIEERGGLAGCAAVLSGYVGDAALGDAVLDAVVRVRAANPGALYCCDPVIGDVGRGVFVREGIPEFMRDRAMPLCDIATPNQFELERLTGREVRNLADALGAAAALRSRGPRVVLVTSLHREGAEPGTIEMLACGADGAWLVATPLLPLSINGAGDMVAALFLGHFLRTRQVAAALEAAAAAVFAVLEATHRAGSRELRLIEAQDALVAPERRFAARQVA
jgi:pyridoxine kinase